MPHQTYDAALRFAPGAMTAASVFGLAAPGLERGTLPGVTTGAPVGGVGPLDRAVLRRIRVRTGRDARGRVPGAGPLAVVDAVIVV
ncbi:hypothetical protein EXE48_07385 [Halorubrum sp. ASP1]|uniref:Uncharacterized protein n=1 Tax=Halorubrum tropicale TaxID=1765655 RepID=A0A0M9AR18_9EURY|nr:MULTISPECIES: hypothetical protein [Halorubrum]KOX95975.1 hypothetical protein AMR74_10520 [Halorubrum tropicale]TKX61618.1 hypothetical protein EXE48_07385 [Halorubrum sp. ASP1]